MRRGRVTWVWGIVTIGICSTLAATLGTVRADTPQAKAQKPVPSRIGWGEPRDGLQIGLFPGSRQNQFRYGDTLALVMRVRNVSGGPVALTMKPADITSVTLRESGRLVLQTLGVGGDAVPLNLAPGETRDLPGGRYAAQIVAPGEKPKTAQKAPAALALLPGEYHAECNSPLWMPDKDDANRATAHRARPGNFTFVVRNDGAHPPTNGKDEKASDASIIWGETVNGLQGGLQRVTSQDLAALPAEERKEIAADEVVTRFYVCNTTDKPLKVAFHKFDENDASFWVKDAQGQDHQVHSVYFTGLRALHEQTLYSGEVILAGSGRLKFQTRQTPQTESITSPLLTAEPGQYTLRLISSVRFAGLNRFDMVLVSASLPFTVPQP